VFVEGWVGVWGVGVWRGVCVCVRALACVRNMFTLMAEKEPKTDSETVYHILSTIYTPTSFCLSRSIIISFF